MKTKLVVIRGNSASGKSMIAKQVRAYFERGEVMIIPQDEIRLGILNVKDRVGNLTPDLMAHIALFGKGKVSLIIIEGILNTAIYQDMLQHLLAAYGADMTAYYLDIPFDETVRRHQTREKSKQWGADVMRRWWVEKDYLGIENEVIFNQDSSAAEMVEKIIADSKGLG